MEAIKMHPFQRTLGDGPYTFVGTFDLGAVIAAGQAGNMGGYNNGMAAAHATNLEAGMGTCAHCGHAITLICIVQIGNGKRYGVGSDCIAKVGLPVRELTKLEKAKRDRAKAQRVARKAAKGDAARSELQALLNANLELLKSKPHPTPYLANQGATLADYASWVIEKSNDGGIVIALARVKAGMKE